MTFCIVQLEARATPTSAHALGAILLSPNPGLTVCVLANNHRFNSVETSVGDKQDLLPAKVIKKGFAFAQIVTQSEKHKTKAHAGQ